MSKRSRSPEAHDDTIKRQRVDALITPSSTTVSVASPVPRLQTPTVTSWSREDLHGGYPSLPAIKDDVLERMVFTHKGSAAGLDHRMTYERLEWIGDSYLHNTATLLISQTFTGMKVGQWAQIRDRLIKNETLAKYALHYGFDRRLDIPRDLLPGGVNAMHPPTYTKICGDLFEAYVGAIVLSDPINGSERAATWLKGLWISKIEADLRKEWNRARDPVDTLMFRGQASLSMLSPANAASCQPESSAVVASSVNGALKPASDASAGSSTRVPFKQPKDELQYQIGHRQHKIEYRDNGTPRKEKETNHPIFSVCVWVRDSSGKEHNLGYGNAKGKKEAGAKAATMALSNKKAIADLRAQKFKLEELANAIEQTPV